MKQRVVRWLLGCYPPSWRVEYGAEFEDLLHRRPLRVKDICNIFWSAGTEQARQPIIRFWLSLLLVSGFLFTTSWAAADPLWRLVSGPALLVLREHGSRPPAL